MFKEFLTKTGRLSLKQPQEVKNQWYIEKCVKTHGNKYDYSELVFTGANSKVVIKCRLHGQFQQRLDQHISGQECPECSRLLKTKSKQDCLAEFQQVHKSTYDYSKVEYTNIDTPVAIICRKHGVFSQTPYTHLRGSGCPKCQHISYSTIYIAKCLLTGLTKIGITKNVKNRISKIGGKLTIVQQYHQDNPQQLEKHLHKVYQKYNVFNNTVQNGGTEFFELTEAQIEEIQQFITSNGGTILL